MEGAFHFSTRQAMLAEAGGRAVGLALWHTTLSTFTCRPGYWLEDIFVE